MLDKNINYILCFFMSILAVMTMCSFFGSSPSEKRKLASKIALKVADTYQKKYGLKFCGISEVAPEGKYENLGMDFLLKRIVSKKEARKILVKVQEDFLDSINENKALREYLLVYPFTGENIVINVIVQNSRGEDAFSPDIGSFSIYDNKLKYRYFFLENNSKFTQPATEVEKLSDVKDEI